MEIHFQAAARRALLGNPAQCRNESKVIEHGRRIRACLKQSEFSPVSVPEQIAVLLALGADLFDAVPIDQMRDAELAVHEAAASIPSEVSARFETAATLNAEDRKTVVDIGRKALERFQPKPEPKSEAGGHHAGAG